MMRQTLFLIACLCAFQLSGNTPGHTHSDLLSDLFSTSSAAEVGKCGYYADSFQGRPTSSGEKYDKNLLTCSHKTLPFGTKVRVTRLDNKKSVVVRVNDRGPFIEGYIVDVSRAAAEELDLIRKGTAQVRVEIVESAESGRVNDAEVASEALGSTNATPSRAIAVKNTATTAAGRPLTYSQTATTLAKTTAKGGTTATQVKVTPSSNLYKVDISSSEKLGYGIQISSLSDANNVLPIVNELQARYADKVLVNVIRDELNQATYKVFVGPYADRKAAETAQKSIAKKYKKTMVVDLSGL